MKVLLNASTSAMNFPCDGQHVTVLPRKQAHPSQTQNVFAFVYDPEAISTEMRDFVERNIRRRYCIHGTALDLEGLRPGQIVVLRKGGTAGRLDDAQASRTTTLTIAALQTRIPELFPGGAVPDAPAAPTSDDMGHRVTKAPTRTVYVARDGGHFQTPWNQIKPGDTLMIREENGEYVKDAKTGDTEFVATGAPYMEKGVWTVATVPVSQKPVEIPKNGDDGIAVDTAQAGATTHTQRDADDDSDESADDDSNDDDSDADEEDDSNDEAEGSSTSGGIATAKLPPVGGVARKRSIKGQGRPAAKGNKKK